MKIDDGRVDAVLSSKIGYKDSYDAVKDFYDTVTNYDDSEGVRATTRTPGSLGSSVFFLFFWFSPPKCAFYAVSPPQLSGPSLPSFGR